MSTEILLEYEEKMESIFSKKASDYFLSSILASPHVLYKEAFTKWNLITIDADDNKFVDCAIWSNAHYLVSNDKHFQSLKHIGFPTLNVLKIDEFIKIIGAK